MAASPPFKVYRNGEYVASCHYPVDAAAICGMTAGTEVRHGHSFLVFREPEHDGNCPGWAAGESWDKAAALMEHFVCNRERFTVERANGLFPN